MKLSDLFEEPYEVTDGVHSDNEIQKYGQMSSATLARDHEFLGSINSLQGEKIKLYALKSPQYAVIRGVIPGYTDHGLNTNFVVFALRFKSVIQAKLPKELDGNKCLQVNSVFIAPEFRGEGITGAVYKLIATKGFSIISDSAQFRDGKELWKKLVRDVLDGEYKIYVLDDEYGFKKDTAGKPIEYDGSNIKDSEIWTSGDDFNGHHKLLVMKA